MTPPLWLQQAPESEFATVRDVQVRLLGVDVTAAYVEVADERQRRADVLLGPLLGYADLCALAELPVDLPVPVRSVDRDAAHRLAALPFGAVDVEAGAFTRRAVEAVRVREVVHQGARWSTALEQVSRFAPYARRSVVLPRMPRNVARVRTDAAYYGVGVCVDTGADREWIAAPAPCRPRRYTPACWLFDETLLAAMSS